MTARWLEVLEVPAFASIQDLGRPGHAHLGVPRSGAVDLPAHLLANRLVGNLDGAATVEVMLGGLRVRSEAALTLAVTGARVRLRVGGRDRDWGEAVSAAAGEVVELGRAFEGLRSYLAVAGGLCPPSTLGSRSTDQLSGLGPAALAAGDRIPLGPTTGRVVGAAGIPARRPTTATLRIQPGPRLDRLTDDAWALLTTSSFEVSSDINRVGVRLTGPALQRRTSEELDSEGIVLGAVQVPPDGQPLVFLNDHPTTGGYPVVAVVAAADLPVVAQLRPGESVRFSP